MRITLKLNDTEIKAVLIDNPTSRDFYSLLPVTLPFKDFAESEKIAYLDRKLSTKDAPQGAKAQAGDLTYYSPWGNLAIFYRDHSFATGLVTLGRLIDNYELLTDKFCAEVTIEKDLNL